MDIEKWIKEFNLSVPLRYFKRNVPGYILTTYINHSLILFKGKHFNSVYMFLKRTADFLEENKELEFDNEYLKTVEQYLDKMSDYLINNDLIRADLKEKYKIRNKN